MRKITFNEETITKIQSFINEGHTKKEVCNKFTIKLETLNRVMRENNIKPHFQEKITSCKELSPDIINLTCKLFIHSQFTLRDICKQVKIRYWQLQQILKDNFTQVEIDKRKSKLYSYSKTGAKNPMKNKFGENHPNFKEVVEDGNGYLMILKPEWYTGRKKSKHVFLHQVIMCQELRLTEIPAGFCVHHIDGNKHNNNISNLCLLTISAHSKLHSLQRDLCKVQRLSK